MSGIAGIVVVIGSISLTLFGEDYDPTAGLVLTEYVGKRWEAELIHYDLSFDQGVLPEGSIKLVSVGGKEHPVQLSQVERHADGSLRRARVSLVVTLEPHSTMAWRLVSGKPMAASDLIVQQTGDRLEVTTSRTGARFQIGERTYDPPASAKQVPAYLTAIRHRSGTWGGAAWFETPHKCRRCRVWIVEQGPVFVSVGFEYAFDGFRGEGQDVYRGHVRIAAQQELIEINEEFSLGDPTVYRIWKPKNRAEEIMWDWWQWRPHEAKHNFCFSIYEPVKPTRARWFGHNSSIPGKRTGRNPGMDFETEYSLDYGQDRFDISINAYLRGCPDQAKSYFAWRAENPASDAIGIIGVRGVDWLHPDMTPHLMKVIVHHTDTADLRIHARKKPDLVVKAPLHLGKRVWGILTLKMPEAARVEDEMKDGKVSRRAFMVDSTEALKLQSKYGNRQLDKVKDWTLAWPSTKTYPSLFIKKGGIEAVRARVNSGGILRKHARSQRHKAIMRYLLDGGEKHAQASYKEVMDWCRRHIDLLFVHGYCSHRGLNNNQYPWWISAPCTRRTAHTACGTTRFRGTCGSASQGHRVRAEGIRSVGSRARSGRTTSTSHTCCSTVTRTASPRPRTRSRSTRVRSGLTPSSMRSIASWPRCL